MHILQPQAHQLSGTDAVCDQRQENREVAPPEGRRPVHGRQQLRHVLPPGSARQAVEGKTGHALDCARDVALEKAGPEGEPQKATQRDDQVLPGDPGEARHVALEELPDPGRRQGDEAVRLRLRLQVLQKRLDLPAIAIHALRGETAVLSQ